MCGIGGYISTRLSERSGHEVLEAMSGVLAHRGPDGRGTFQSGSVGMVHRRLSIIDIEQGQQPMTTADGKAVGVFNGEIYNYVELRKELAARGATFRTTSDTEVLLEAYRHWGVDCVKRFNGDFAFAIFDTTLQKVCLGRDRLGVKPLHIARRGDGLFFASEAQALLGPLDIQPTLNPYGFIEQLTFGQPVAPNCFVNEVEVVEPGTIAEFDLNGRCISSRRYWRLRRDNAIDDVQDLSQAIHDGLSEATRLRLRSDVEVACLLSGGLDSSALTYLAKEHSQSLSAYSIDHELSTDGTASRQLAHIHGSDAERAMELAKALDLEHHFIKVGADGQHRHLEAVAECRLSPVTLGSELAMYTLFEKVSKQHKVVISGDAADELYLGYYMQFDALQRANQLDPYFVAPSYKLFPALRKRVFGFDANEYVQHRFSEILNESDLDPQAPDYPFHAMHYLQLRVMLPYLLDRLDRISMAHGVEVRVPFTDHNLIDQFYRIPAALKFENTEKAALRNAFRGKLPSNIVDRKKSVFPYANDDKGVARLKKKVFQQATFDSLTGKGLSKIFNVPKLLSANQKNKGQIDSFQTHAMMLQLLSMRHLINHHTPTSRPKLR
ncbi:asparagine synthase (glutamine-hydrolyzing) [Marinobacter sp. LN3S78]|uniref:asparagine synthase (glutamine-hydrolyzing) n=1 Tax=Marinobacter sp. LN3S78 TaxID=3382300 RepID=UPI00387AC26C